MNNINFHFRNPGWGHQIVDCGYAYLQSQHTDYHSSTLYQISDDYDQSATNVLCEYFPNSINDGDVDRYDLILFCNGVESSAVATACMIDIVRSTPHAYVIANTYMSDDHPWRDRFIWFPGYTMECRNVWSKHFYPHFFENHRLRELTRDQSIIYINGKNTSWRYHFQTLLAQTCPDIHQRNTIDSYTNETLQSFTESEQDREFRTWVNHQYRHSISNSSDNDYYRQSPGIGINHKFGTVSLGFQILPEYYQYQCVVFPETQWQNDELAITEKSLKCFYAGSWAWPVGGRYLNHLYRELGYYTAWNLLPTELQSFDLEPDHRVRYQQQVLALKWLSQNLNCMENESALMMLQSNQFNFQHCAGDLTATENFCNIVDKHVR